MKIGKLEKILLTICVASVLTTVGYFVKDGFKTYRTYTEDSQNQNTIVLEIDGEVEKPGTYRMKENSRTCDLIYKAGGITLNADVDAVKLDAILTDGMKITVPATDDEFFDGSPVVNINTADIDELMLVPGIGETLASRIVEYRRIYGSFSDVSEITRVRGVGEKTLKKIKDYIKTED